MGGQRASGIGWALLAAAAAAATACARPMAPPGGERDEVAPSIVSITPEPMSTIAPGDDPVVIAFDERISEQDIEDAVYVSPATGAVELEKGRRDLEIGIAGGWEPNRVYRIVVRPTVRDLFGNAIAAPVEIAFSTGAPFHAGALAGVVYERVTGQPVRDARVEAEPANGGAYHLALTDTGGVFRMPLVPPGVYVLRGYADQNRDRRRDEYELADSIMVEVGADTLLRPLALMRSDSSAANLTRVQVVDSLTLRLSFDDYMDVRAPQIDARVLLRSLPDSAVVPLAGVHYPHALAEARARQDSIRADSLAAAAAVGERADTTTPPVRVPRPPRDTIRLGEADTAAADSVLPDPLTERVRAAGLRPPADVPPPARELLVVLERPLTPEAEYVVQVTGILNLSGIGAGGGVLTFRAPAPPPPPETPVDQDDAADEAPPADDPDANAPPASGVPEPVETGP